MNFILKELNLKLVNYSMNLEFINNYKEYIKSLRELESTDEFHSILYCENSLSSLIYFFFNKLFESNNFTLVTLFFLIILLIVTSFLAFYFKNKYDNVAPRFCRICMTEISNIIIVRCGHLCLCQNCLKGWIKEKGSLKSLSCPLCRCVKSSLQIEVIKE